MHADISEWKLWAFGIDLRQEMPQKRERTAMPKHKEKRQKDNQLQITCQ
jgi:hypothetical protein